MSWLRLLCIAVFLTVSVGICIGCEPIPAIPSEPINKDPSEFAFELADMGPGKWKYATTKQTYSRAGEPSYLACFSQWMKEDSLYPSHISCNIQVLPNIDSAHEAYLEAMSKDTTKENIGIGDESSIDTSLSYKACLVFRKYNVLVKVEATSDGYNTPADRAQAGARIIEEKIR